MKINLKQSLRELGYFLWGGCSEVVLPQMAVVIDWRVPQAVVPFGGQLVLVNIMGLQSCGIETQLIFLKPNLPSTPSSPFSLFRTFPGKQVGHFLGEVLRKPANSYSMAVPGQCLKLSQPCSVCLWTLLRDTRSQTQRADQEHSLPHCAGGTSSEHS